MFEYRTPESRDNIDPTVSFLGTICDISAIRRPIRLPMVTGALGDLYRISAAYLLHPNIEFSTPI